MKIFYIVFFYFEMKHNSKKKMMLNYVILCFGLLCLLGEDLQNLYSNIHHTPQFRVPSLILENHKVMDTYWRMFPELWLQILCMQLLSVSFICYIKRFVDTRTYTLVVYCYTWFILALQSVIVLRILKLVFGENSYILSYILLFKW